MEEVDFVLSCKILRVPMRGVCVRVCVSVHKHSAFCLIVTYIGQNLGRVFKIIGQGRSRTRSFFSDGSRSLSKIMTCFIVGGEIPSPRALFPSVLFCLFVCLSAGWDKKLWINVLIFWWRSGHSAIKWSTDFTMIRIQTVVWCPSVRHVRVLRRHYPLPFSPFKFSAPNLILQIAIFWQDAIQVKYEKIAIFHQYLALCRKWYKICGISYYGMPTGTRMDLSNGAISNNLEWSVTQISRSRYYMMLNISETVRDRHSYNEIAIGTYTCQTQGCHFEWPWGLSNLAKYSMT